MALLLFFIVKPLFTDGRQIDDVIYKLFMLVFNYEMFYFLQLCNC